MEYSLRLNIDVLGLNLQTEPSLVAILEAR